MTDDEEKKMAMRILVDTGGNLALAVALGAVVPWALRLLGVDPDLAGKIALVSFFVVIFCDPVSAWRGTQTWRGFGVKVVSGAIIGSAIMAIFTLLDLGVLEPRDTGSEPAALQVAAEAEDEAPGGLWFAAIPLLILPIAFLGPMLERIINGKGPDGAPLTRDDLLIGVTFPLYMLALFALNGLVVGALFVIGAPLAVGLLVLTAGILIAVAEAWFATPDETLPDFEDGQGWGERARDGAAALAGLRKAIRASMSSALFMGGMMFTTISLSLLMVGEGMGVDEPDLGFLVDFAKIMGIVLLGSTALMLFGVLLAVSLSYLVGRRHGLDLLALADLAKQSVSRLFIGGMHFVRPDIDEVEKTDTP